MPIFQGPTNALGKLTPDVSVMPAPFIMHRAPTTNDFARIGQMWIHTDLNDVYILTSIVSGQAIWMSPAGGAGVFDSVTATTGDITAILGNIVADAGGFAGNFLTITGNGDFTGNVGVGNDLSVGGDAGVVGSMNIGVDLGVAGNLMVDGNTIFNSTITVNGNGDFFNHDDDAVGAFVTMSKDRAGATVQTGDNLGSMIGYGFDGSNYEVSSYITFTAAGTIGAGTVPGKIGFTTFSDTSSILVERMTIDENGTVTINAAEAGFTLDITSSMQITTGDIEMTDGDIYIGDQTASAVPPVVYFNKSRGGGVITTGDILGDFEFRGNDGSADQTGARIRALTSGTIAANRIPSNLEFWTHPDAATPILRRMYIEPSGNVVIQEPDSSHHLILTQSTGGDASMQYHTGSQDFVCGIDNSTTNDDWVLSHSTALGTNDIISIDGATGAVTISDPGTNLPGLLSNGPIEVQSAAQVRSGTGSPNAVVTAPQGSIFLRTDGASADQVVYVNTDGATAWTPLIS